MISPNYYNAVQTLTVSSKAADFLVLQPEDVLQPVSFVEIGETSQSTNQDCRQRGEELYFTKLLVVF